jgi:hypothetical protein
VEKLKRDEFLHDVVRVYFDAWNQDDEEANAIVGTPTSCPLASTAEYATSGRR